MRKQTIRYLLALSLLLFYLFFLMTQVTYQPPRRNYDIDEIKKINQNSKLQVQGEILNPAHVENDQRRKNLGHQQFKSYGAYYFGLQDKFIELITIYDILTDQSQSIYRDKFDYLFQKLIINDSRKYNNIFEGTFNDDNVRNLYLSSELQISESPSNLKMDDEQHLMNETSVTLLTIIEQSDSQPYNQVDLHIIQNETTQYLDGNYSPDINDQNDIEDQDISNLDLNQKVSDMDYDSKIDYINSGSIVKNIEQISNDQNVQRSIDDKESIQEDEHFIQALNFNTQSLEELQQDNHNNELILEIQIDNSNSGLLIKNNDTEELFIQTPQPYQQDEQEQISQDVVSQTFNFEKSQQIIVARNNFLQYLRLFNDYINFGCKLISNLKVQLLNLPKNLKEEQIIKNPLNQQEPYQSVDFSETIPDAQIEANNTPINQDEGDDSQEVIQELKNNNQEDLPEFEEQQKETSIFEQKSQYSSKRIKLTQNITHLEGIYNDNIIKEESNAIASVIFIILIHFILVWSGKITNNIIKCVKLDSQKEIIPLQVSEKSHNNQLNSESYIQKRKLQYQFFSQLNQQLDFLNDSFQGLISQQKSFIEQVTDSQNDLNQSICLFYH